MNKSVTEKVEQFFDTYKSISFKTGDILLQPNGQISTIFYIKSGSVRQYINSPDGERLTLQIFKPHAFIPLVMFLSEPFNKYTFQAVVPTEVRAAPVEEVVKFLKENPDVLFGLTTRLSRAIAGLIEKFELTAFENAYTRVLSLLVHLGLKFGEIRGEECLITLPLSHYDIASLIGLRRETVSRRMELMQEEGLLRYEQEHIVLVNFSQAKREIKKNLL